MTTFGWKRKIGDKVSRASSEAFESDAQAEEDLEEVDWLSGQPVPKKKILILEDARAKSKRLKDEGALLAEESRYWEACKKFDQALDLVPNDERLFEMKAQAYMCLNEVYPALNAAEKAVHLSPNWWVGQQTLGRAQMGLGEVRKAIKSFSRALHLYPADEELWTEDFRWAVDLLKKKETIQSALVTELQKENKVQITELNSEDETNLDVVPRQQSLVKATTPLGESKMDTQKQNDVRLDNYVKMRDY